jgi:hypothetical protein
MTRSDAVRGLVGWISMHGPVIRDHINGEVFTPAGGSQATEPTTLNGQWRVQTTSTDGISVASWASRFNPAKGTWLMWIRSDDSSSFMTPLNIRYDGGNEIDINEFNGGYNGGNSVRFKYAGSGSAVELFLPALVVGSVTLLGMTWDTTASEMRGFVNGLQVGSPGTGLPAMTQPTTAAIANNTSLNASLRGGIGEVMLFDRALSPAEMWTFYDPRSRWQLYARQKTAVNAWDGSAANVTLSPAQAALVFSGQSASISVNVILAPDQAALLLSGQAPTVITGYAFVSGAAALTVSGQTPAMQFGFRYDPEQAAVTLSGQVPSIVLALLAEMPQATLAITGLESTLSVSVGVDPRSDGLILIRRA